MEFPLVLASLRRLLNYLKSHFKLAFRGVTSTLLSADGEGRERTRKTLYIYVYDNICCRCCFEAENAVCLPRFIFYSAFFAAWCRKNVYRNIAVLLCLHLCHPQHKFFAFCSLENCFRWKKRWIHFSASVQVLEKKFCLLTEYLWKSFQCCR